MVKQSALLVSKTILLVALLVVIGLSVAAITRVDALTPTEPSEVKDSKIAPQQPPEQMALAVSTDAKPPHNRFAVKRILEIDEPFVHGYWIWDDEGVPDGEIIITVDLKAESLSVFRDGYEIGAAVITFGDALKPTPTGVFPITQKNADHISNIYGTPMPYMLRMTNDGISIHGTDVKWGWGTRGCIGVPTEFAALLFEQVKLGDRVIVTNGKMMQLNENGIKAPTNS